MASGVDYRLFWHLNPTKLKPFFEADKIKLKNRMSEIETSAYVNGIYVARAVGACFSKGSKYPEKPLGIFDFDKREQKELTEEEIELAREKLIANLQLMQVNFEVNKIKEHAP